MNRQSDEPEDKQPEDILSKNHNNLEEYVKLCSIPAVQEKIRERMGTIQPGDWVARYDMVGFVLTIGEPHEIFVRFSENCQRMCAPEDLIRLPQVHDLQNPERGLWGMVDWKRLNPCINSHGNMGMYEKDKNGVVYPQARWNYPPTLALLKALMHHRHLC